VRVIVTGKGGFIGQHLCRALAESQLELEEAAAARRADALVHLAFPTSAEYRRAEPDRARADALAATAHALELATRASARHVVLASTGKVYAPSASLPITEAHAVGPTTFLGELKLLVERRLELASARDGLGVTSLRIFNVYGPGQRGDFLIPRLLDQLDRGDRVVLGELDHARDWIHVRDVCAAFACSLLAPAPPGTFRALNVATGTATSAGQIVGLVASVLGRAISVERDARRARPNEVAEERASAALLGELGWTATTPLEAGIRELFEPLRA
jgi:nucleoside-diphosphate-sugar epimerase